MDLFNLFAPEAEVLDPSWDRISIDQIGPTDFPDYPEMDVEGETGSAPDHEGGFHLVSPKVNSPTNKNWSSLI